MTPTPDELLRLARKAWPDESEVCLCDIERPGHIAVDDGYGSVLASVEYHERAPQALHAALLVLSGELDVAALVAERDRLRAERDSLRATVNDAFIAIAKEDDP